MQHSFLLNSHRKSIKLFHPFPGQEPGDVPPIPVPPYPQQSPLGRKAEPCLWVFRCARPEASRDLSPFIPVAGFISKSRNRPFEQIRRNQRHRGKVLFTAPFLQLFLRCGLIISSCAGTFTEKKLRTEKRKKEDALRCRRRLRTGAGKPAVRSEKVPCVFPRMLL